MLKVGFYNFDNDVFISKLSSIMSNMCNKMIQIKLTVLSDEMKKDSFNVLFINLPTDTRHILDCISECFYTNKHCLFVFLATDYKYVNFAFKVRAFRYVLKPITLFKLKDILGEVIDFIVNDYEFILCNGNNPCLLKLDQIYYFESLNKKILAIEETIETEFCDTLKRLSLDLDKRGFVRCHNSYLVNIQKVKYINSDKLILNNGKVLPIGRAYNIQLKKYYNNYIRKQVYVQKLYSKCMFCQKN